MSASFRSSRLSPARRQSTATCDKLRGLFARASTRGGDGSGDGEEAYLCEKTDTLGDLLAVLEDHVVQRRILRAVRLGKVDRLHRHALLLQLRVHHRLDRALTIRERDQGAGVSQGHDRDPAVAPEAPDQPAGGLQLDRQAADQHRGSGPNKRFVDVLEDLATDGHLEQAPGVGGLGRPQHDRGLDLLLFGLLRGEAPRVLPQRPDLVCIVAARLELVHSFQPVPLQVGLVVRVAHRHGPAPRALLLLGHGHEAVQRLQRAVGLLHPGRGGQHAAAARLAAPSASVPVLLSGLRFPTVRKMYIR